MKNRDVPEQFSVKNAIYNGRGEEAWGTVGSAPDGGEGRLYFIIRSFVMSQIAGALFLIIVYFLGAVNFVQAIIIGIFQFVASLVLSRLFDVQIGKVIGKSLNLLNKYKKAKKLILKYF